tara:strand:- start:13010 stop:13615 length:606 start_codon:yes stop_codon:yes gene_type:complete
VLSSEALAALDTGRFATRNGFYVTMPTETVAFWDDAYAATIDSVTYEAGAGVFTIGGFSSGGDLVTRSLDITLSGIDADIASRVMAEPWHQRPVVVSRFVIAIDAPQVIYSKQWFSGFLDVIEWQERAGGASSLVAHCEDIGRELGRKGARTRSATDQRQLAADDAFFDGVVTSITTEINWGRIVTTAAQPEPRRKLFGIF